MFCLGKREIGIALLLLIGGAPLARGDEGLVLFPRRIVLEVDERESQVSLVNLSAEPVRFEAALERLRMDEYGAWSTVAVALPGELFADDIVRFAPRRGEVPPNTTQVIRFQRLGVPHGAEARAHVAIAITKDDDMTVIRLPLLVKRRPDALARVRALRWSEPEAVEVLLEREGTTTAYGAVELEWVRSDGRTEACQRRDVAIYPPFAQRIVLLAVQPRSSEWSLRARFVDGSDLPGRGFGYYPGRRPAFESTPNFTHAPLSRGLAWQRL